MKSLMPDMDPKQRLQILKDNADTQEETTYFKDLSQEDLDVKRELLTESLIKLSEYEEELTEFKKSHKIKCDPLKVQNKTLLTEVKTRKQEVTGMLYNIADHDAGIMETYDEQGEFVSSRRLRPNEKQQKLFSLSKAANDE